MSYIKALPIKRAMALLNYAQEQEEKEIMFRYYLTQLPYMDKNSFVTFDQYVAKNKPSRAKLDQRPMDEIIDEVMGMKFD